MYPSLNLICLVIKGVLFRQYFFISYFLLLNLDRLDPINNAFNKNLATWVTCRFEFLSCSDIWKCWLIWNIVDIVIFETCGDKYRFSPSSFQNSNFVCNYCVITQEEEAIGIVLWSLNKKACYGESQMKGSWFRRQMFPTVPWQRQANIPICTREP